MNYELKGIHPGAFLNGKEDYTVLQIAGKELFKEINELIDLATIDVNGHQIKLEFFLGGDYKVT